MSRHQRAVKIACVVILAGMDFGHFGLYCDLELGTVLGMDFGHFGLYCDLELGTVLIRSHHLKFIHFRPLRGAI